MHGCARGGAIFRQNDAQSAAAKRLSNVPGRQQTDADARQHELADELAGIGAHVAVRMKLRFAGRSFEPPHLGRVGGEAVVGFEVDEVYRRAVPLEVRGRSADDARVGGDTAGDERGVFQLADADGEVEAFADDIDERVADMHVELYLGIAGEEVVEVGGDVQPAEGRRHRHLQQTARLGVAATDEVFRLLAQAEDVDDALEVTGARLGERQMPGRALKQARPEAILELADALGYDGRG